MRDVQQQQARLEEAFERIEETILPCIAMMLDTLLDASANLAELDPKVLIAELQTLAAELEELTRAVERNSPAHVEPGEYRGSPTASRPAAREARGRYSRLTATTTVPGTISAFPASNAAIDAAPPGSTTSRCSCHAQRIAAATSPR